MWGHGAFRASPGIQLLGTDAASMRGNWKQEQWDASALPSRIPRVMLQRAGNSSGKVPSPLPRRRGADTGRHLTMQPQCIKGSKETPRVPDLSTARCKIPTPVTQVLTHFQLIET